MLKRIFHDRSIVFGAGLFLCPVDIQRLGNVPRKCTICIHKKRNEIETSFLEDNSYRTISHHFRVSINALKRHVKNDHIAKSLIKAHEINKIVNADDLVFKILHLQKETLIVLAEAKEEKNHNTILAAVGKASGLIELQAKLIGQLKETQVNINVFQQSSKTLIFLQDKYPGVLRGLVKYLKEKYDDI